MSQHCLYSVNGIYRLQIHEQEPWMTQIRIILTMTMLFASPLKAEKNWTYTRIIW